MKSIKIICAVDNEMGFGGAPSWPHIRADLAHFKALTMGHTVLMGRRTFESLPGPLHGRQMALLSRTPSAPYRCQSEPKEVPCRHQLEPKEVPTFATFDEAIAALPGPTIWAIGGHDVYRAALNHPLCQTLHLTIIVGQSLNCSVRFPATIDALIASGWRGTALREAQEGPYRLHFYTYERPNADELAYLCLLSELCHLPTLAPNRTGIRTKRAFSRHLEFNLMDGQRPILPLLTTKKMAIEAIIHELIWFLRGDTSTQYLTENNIHIWDKNTNRASLDALGLHNYPEGELGPGYGFQWRHFGASYAPPIAASPPPTEVDEAQGETPAEIDRARRKAKKEQGIDQIRALIEGIKADPFSRRHVLTAWNPAALHLVALPPCHAFTVFYVDSDDSSPETPTESPPGNQTKNRLSAHLTMRSGDMALGVPFNIASYALLVHIIAHLTGLQPGRLHISIVDAHVYENHIEGALIQTTRAPIRFPTVAISPLLQASYEAEGMPSIDSISRQSVSITQYYHHPAIKLDMAP